MLRVRPLKYVLTLILGCFCLSIYANTLIIHVKNTSSSVQFLLKGAQATDPNTTIEGSTSTVREKQIANNYLTASTADTSTPNIMLIFIPTINNKTDDSSTCLIRINGDKPSFNCANKCSCKTGEISKTPTGMVMTLTLDYKATNSSTSGLTAFTVAH